LIPFIAIIMVILFVYLREKREEELEYFMTKKYNKLGAKVQTKVNTLNGLVQDQDLLLKWKYTKNV